MPAGAFTQVGGPVDKDEPCFFICCGEISDNRGHKAAFKYEKEISPRWLKTIDKHPEILSQWIDGKIFYEMQDDMMAMRPWRCCKTSDHVCNNPVCRVLFQACSMILMKPAEDDTNTYIAEVMSAIPTCAQCLNVHLKRMQRDFLMGRHCKLARHLSTLREVDRFAAIKAWRAGLGVGGEGGEGGEEGWRRYIIGRATRTIGK
jgi:hypothetical protein